MFHKVINIKKIILIAFLIFSTIFANLNINSCGSYAQSSDGSSIVDINITADISANSGNNNGSCIYLELFESATPSSDVQFRIYGRNHTITQAGSSATIGLYIKTNGHNSNGQNKALMIYNIDNFTIEGFNEGIKIDSLGGFYDGPANLINQTRLDFRTFNVGNIISSSSVGLPTPFIFNSYICNADNYTSLDLGNITAKIHNYNCSEPQLKYVSNLTPYGISGDNLISNTNTTNTLFWNSNKLFYGNCNLGNGTIYNTSYGFFRTYNNQTFSIQNTSYELFLGYVYSKYKIADSLTNTNIYNVTGKCYYCIQGGYCNPLYFENYSNFPFIISAPDVLQSITLSNSYDKLRVYWKNGLQDYLIASSVNTQDIYLYLQPNGIYTFEIESGGNITNTTVINTCPTSSTICVLLIQNGSYGFTWNINYNQLVRDVSYNLYLENSTKNITLNGAFIDRDMNITFVISSASAGLSYYGMQVLKYYNGTTTTIYNNNITNSSAGGNITVQTNGTGKYIIYAWYKHLNYQEYRPVYQQFFIGNKTGLSLISNLISSGTIINDWAYGFVSLILTMIVMAFIARYSLSAAGIGGILIFGFFAFIYPTALLAGGFTMETAWLLTLAIGISIYWLRQYV